MEKFHGSNVVLTRLERYNGIVDRRSINVLPCPVSKRPLPMAPSFESPADVVARYKRSATLAARADALGSHARSMSADRFFRFCEAAAEHAEVSERSRYGLAYVVDDKGRPVVSFDVETDPINGERRRINERVDIFFVCVTDSALKLAYRHGDRNVDRPRWHPLGDGLRFRNLRDVRSDDRTTVAMVRHARRRPEATIDPMLADAIAYYGVNVAMTKGNPRDNGEESSHMFDATAKDRADILRFWRSSGHRSGTLRYAADALVSARFSGDELSVAVFAAVLQAGTWAILADMPNHKRSACKRSAMPPCDGLEDYIGSGFKLFASHCPASLIRDHIARHFFDVDADDPAVWIDVDTVADDATADTFSPSPMVPRPVADVHGGLDVASFRTWIRHREYARRAKGIEFGDAWASYVARYGDKEARKLVASYIDGSALPFQPVVV